MTEILSSSEEQALLALWEYLLKLPKSDTQPFVNVLLLGCGWVMANLPNLFSGIAVRVSLLVWSVYSAWALTLYVYLRRLSRKKTVNNVRQRTLLGVFDNGICLMLLSGAMLMFGLQLAPVDLLWKRFLLGSYGATLVLAGLFGYQWLILPRARSVSEGRHLKLNRAGMAMRAGPASVAAFGVFLGHVLSRTVSPNIGLLFAGGLFTTVAFLLGTFGAGAICQVFILARSRATRL